MARAVETNMAMIRHVAERFGPLRDRVVFLGGAATALLIDFFEVLAGHLFPGPASQQRIPLLLERAHNIAGAMS